MGCFDTMIGICPFCLKEAESQTKLGHCSCLSIREGENLGIKGTLPVTICLQLKDKCSCGHILVARIENGIFTGFTMLEPHYKELPWGEVEKCQ